MLTWVEDMNPALRQGLVDAAEKSISLQPDRPDVWLALANLLNEIGRYEQAGRILNEGAERFPTDVKLRISLADTYRKLGEYEAALAAMDIALSLSPDDREATVKRFEILVAADRWEHVARDLANMTRVAPDHRAIIQAHAHFALEDAAAEALLAVCESILARRPGHTFALHQKAVALSLLGRNAEACAVMGLGDFVGLAELPLPNHYVDGVAVLDTLAAEVLRNPTLTWNPRGKATREGQQTRVLAQAGDKAVPLLLEQIRSAVERYAEALPALPHPFVTARPARVRLNAWGVVYPRHGRQKSHLHPAGWLSGVAYVGAPRSAGASDYRGSLVLGALDADRYPEPPAWGTRDVEPIPGRIVLFPSFVPHATQPTGLDEQRICIAFDVVPA
jgi:tetratricopeptide (TPR) repeat protein